MSRDLWNLPATPERIRAMGRAASLSEAEVSRALHIASRTPDAKAWQQFLSRALALFGAALVLAGVVSFVAFNWTRIGRFGKFALVEVAIVAAALLAWRTLPRLSGQIALAGAAVLVGPLLAIYGQTYQTGADPYGLFLTWLVLILPWVVAARFTLLWLFALLLLDVGLALLWTQVISSGDMRADLTIFLVIGGVHLLALVAWEWQRRRAEPWLTEGWAPAIIALMGFSAFFVPAAFVVIDGRDAGLPGLVALPVLAVSIVSALGYYTRARVDRFMVTLAGATTLAMLGVAIGRVIFIDLDLDEGGLLLMALVVLAEITFGLRWLRRSGAAQPGTRE